MFFQVFFFFFSKQNEHLCIVNVFLRNSHRFVQFGKKEFHKKKKNKQQHKNRVKRGSPVLFVYFSIESIKSSIRAGKRRIGEKLKTKTRRNDTDY